MTKLDLQKELLEKIKPGMKPSDLKKPQLNTPASSPPASPIIVPVDKKSQPKPKSESISPSPIEIETTEQIKQLQEQVNFHAQTAQTHLTNLQATLAQLDQAELIIQELQEKNEKLNKTIANQSNQVKITAEPQPQESKTFLCSDCQQTKPQTELSRVFGKHSFCLSCSKKARLQAQQEKNPEPQPTDFTCHSCQQTKQEIPSKMKLDSTLTEYLVCSSCRPNLKEFNEADLITDDLWAKYPYSSASEILEKEFGIVKEAKW